MLKPCPLLLVSSALPWPVKKEIFFQHSMRNGQENIQKEKKKRLLLMSGPSALDLSLCNIQTAGPDKTHPAFSNEKKWTPLLGFLSFHTSFPPLHSPRYTVLPHPHRCPMTLQSVCLCADVRSQIPRTYLYAGCLLQHGDIVWQWISGSRSRGFTLAV